jgi:hypothetical protein
MTISHSTMNYRKVMTKLNENNVTFVIQTISSMNYFDSGRKYNGNAYPIKIEIILPCHFLCSFCILFIIFILLI